MMAVRGFEMSYHQPAYAKVGFAKLYDRQTPLTAADLLNDRVIPFYEEQGIPLQRVLTDRGTEYCGTHDRHEYELYLAVVELREADLGVGVDQGLLVDASDALEGSDMRQVSWAPQ